MPYKNKTKQLEQGAYYHAYNRGYNKQKIFLDNQDYQMFVYLLKKYLGNFAIDTEIFCRNDRYYIRQSIVSGVDLFGYLKKHPEKINKQILRQFTFCLDKLYKNTKILPDLVGRNNIFITKTNKIKLVDVWPLFFHKRVIDKDLNKESYRENLDQLKSLHKFID